MTLRKITKLQAMKSFFFFTKIINSRIFFTKIIILEYYPV